MRVEAWAVNDDEPRRVPVGNCSIEEGGEGGEGRLPRKGEKPASHGGRTPSRTGTERTTAMGPKGKPVRRGERIFDLITGPEADSKSELGRQKRPRSGNVYKKGEKSKGVGKRGHS